MESRQTDPVTEEDVHLWFREQAARLRWTTAKSKDHQYIVRHKVGNQIYEPMGQAILKYGKPGRWYGADRLYLTPGDGKRYWLMTFDITESIILNRADDDGIMIHGW